MKPGGFTGWSFGGAKTAPHASLSKPCRTGVLICGFTPSLRGCLGVVATNSTARFASQARTGIRGPRPKNTKSNSSRYSRPGISRSREIDGHERSDVPNLPLMKPLTRGGCPNGEPSGARSEFCRVTPHSKRFLVTFWRKQKVTAPPGAVPAPVRKPLTGAKNEPYTPHKGKKQGPGSHETAPYPSRA